MRERTYIAIDLKSFYASVECVDRGLDPLTSNLVVADLSRTEKTICLAVSPSLKAYGIPGRARLFEVVSKVRDINKARSSVLRGGSFSGESTDSTELAGDPSLKLGFIAATPRMARYLEVSGQVYSVYLKYIAPEDIHVYSVDEVFMDVTEYLPVYACTPHELAIRMIRDVLKTTGITATAGIGTNMYLAKVAMDIEAKHQKADSDGVRIAELDEMSYREKLWDHVPLTDFWRVGRGTAARLEAAGIRTMGDIALRSENPDWESWFYKVFGVNAELLIDHAWGWEPCGMKDVKAYRPQSSSLGIGQVLQKPFTFRQGRVALLEMADSLALDLVEKRLLAGQIVVYVGYDSSSDTSVYSGPSALDHYGRKVPAPAHGSMRLDCKTSSARIISSAAAGLYDRLVNPGLHVRRLNITAAEVEKEDEAVVQPVLDLFGGNEDPERERRRQEAIIGIKKKFGKNSILKGLDFEDGATARERNMQIGGHKA